MSRHHIVLPQPVDFVSGKASSVSYGLDHACGYFICTYGINSDEPIDEFDSYGFGMAGKEAFKQHSNAEMGEYFKRLGLEDVASNVFMDLPI